MVTIICAVQEKIKGKNKRGVENTVVKKARGDMKLLVRNLSLMPKDTTAPSVGGIMITKYKCLSCTTSGPSMRARGYFQGDFTNLQYVFQQSLGLCLIPIPKPMIPIGNCICSGTLLLRDNTTHCLEGRGKVDKV